MLSIMSTIGAFNILLAFARVRGLWLPVPLLSRRIDMHPLKFVLSYLFRMRFLSAFGVLFASLEKNAAFVLNIKCMRVLSVRFRCFSLYSFLL